MSRIGNQSITLPENVKVEVSSDSVIKVEGPKGSLSYTLPGGIALEQEEGTVKITRDDSVRGLRALHGTARSLVSNMVEGVSTGFSKELDIQGVGFKAALKGKVLNLALGFSHPIDHPIPEGLNVAVEDNTTVKIEGIDKQMVGQFAAEVRSYRPPEPYKGKGVRYVDEQVRRKAGKSVQE